MENAIDKASTHFGGPSALAKVLNVTPSFVTQVSKGRRKLPLTLALLIDRETGGQITAEHLRPDIDWNRGRDLEGAAAQAGQAAA